VSLFAKELDGKKGGGRDILRGKGLVGMFNERVAIEQYREKKKGLLGKERGGSLFSPGRGEAAGFLLVERGGFLLGCCRRGSDKKSGEDLAPDGGM